MDIKTEGAVLHLQAVPDLDHDPGRRFEVGPVTATKEALGAVPIDEILNALSRHVRADLGLTPEHLAESMLESKNPVLSMWESTLGAGFLVLTCRNTPRTAVMLWHELKNFPLVSHELADRP